MRHLLLSEWQVGIGYIGKVLGEGEVEMGFNNSSRAWISWECGIGVHPRLELFIGKRRDE